MRYVYMYALIVILVIILGCAKSQETVTPEPATAPSTAENAATSPSAAQEPAAEMSYELSSEEEAKAIEFEQGKKTSFSTPYKIMQVGDAYVFGLGIKNVMPNEKNFKIDVAFSEAKTTGGLATLINTADDNTMLSWIGKNKFSIIKVNPNENKIVPFILEVKPTIGPGEDTIPGSYVFDIEIKYESTPGIWLDYGKETLTIKVK